MSVIALLCWSRTRNFCYDKQQRNLGVEKRVSDRDEELRRNESQMNEADQHRERERGTEPDGDELFSEEEYDQYLREAEEEEPYTPFFQSKWVKRGIAVIAALVLGANVLAFLPQIYSLAAIRFVTVSAQLSQSEEIQAYKQAVVVVTADDRKGTGFHLASAPGLIVTNRHVVEDAPVVNVAFPDGSRYSAQVVARDETVDLAIVKAKPAAEHVGLPLAPSSEGTAGTPIYVIGNPLFFNGIANQGVVREAGSSREPPMMVLQAPIYKGNSGSPVIAEDGRVIGVVFATTRMDTDGGRERVGLAVPVERVHQLLSWE